MKQRSKVLVVDFGSATHGAAAYQSMLVEAFAPYFEVKRYALEFARGQVLKLATAPLKVAHLTVAFADASDCALMVETELSILWPWGRRRPTIAVLHHLGSSKNWLYARLEGQLIQRLRIADAVVVPSEYWNEFLRVQGFTNVRTIYNPFRLDEFVFEDGEVEAFKSRFALTGKPIVYLGANDKPKGSAEAFEALRHLDAHFVASGNSHNGANPSMRCLYLDRRDYLLLLKASCLAVTMSHFAEGWCRVAHEAMLCGTPVLGSGKGGMRELLVPGGQIICSSFEELRHQVEDLLTNPDRRTVLGETGIQFASQFTFERFQSSWLNLARQVFERSGAEAANATPVLSSPN
jgi:glycosyltransferase involved in cell wall biosynthesis